MSSPGKVRNLIVGAASWPPLRVSGKILPWGLLAAVPLVSGVLLWDSARNRDGRVWFPNDPQYSVEAEKKADPSGATGKEGEIHPAEHGAIPGNLGRLQGVVKDRSGKPVEGCTVLFVPFNGVWNPEPLLHVKNGNLSQEGSPTVACPWNPFAVVSAKDGAFQIDLPAGAFKIYAWAHDFAPATKGAVIKAGICIKRLEITLEDGAWFEGRIEARDGAEEGETEMLALTPAIPFRFSQQVEKDSSFRFQHLPGGPYTLLASRNGRLVGWAGNVISGSQGLRIQVFGAAKGKLRSVDDSSKTPLANRAFRVALPNVPEDAFSAEALSDARGEVTLPPLLPGTYLLRCGDPGVVDLYYAFQLDAEGRSRPEEIRFERGQTIEGLLLDDDTGEPVENALVCWVPAPQPGTLLSALIQNLPGAVIRRWTSTDAQGRFRFERASPGPSLFLVVHEGHAPTRFVSPPLAQSKEKDDNRPLEPLAIRLRRGGSVSGLALCKFEALVAYDEDGFFRMTFADGAGKFELPCMVSGPCSLTSLNSLKGMGRHPAAGVHIQDGCSSRIEFNDKMYGFSPSVEGDLRDAGLPVLDAEVFLVYPWDLNGRFAQKAEMKDGHFTYKNVRQGKYTMEVRRRGDTYRKFIEIKDKVGHVVSDINLPKGEINIEVCGDGCSLAGRNVEIVLYCLPPGSLSWSVHSTAKFKDFEGRATGTFRYLDGGRYLLVGQGAGLAPEASEEIDISKQKCGFNVPFLLGLGEKAEVEVLDDAGKPIEGAHLRAFTPGGNERRLINAFTGRNGRVTVLLKQGNYVLRVEAKGFKRGESGPVKIAQGSRATLTIRLVPEPDSKKQDD